MIRQLAPVVILFAGLLILATIAIDYLRINGASVNSSLQQRVDELELSGADYYYPTSTFSLERALDCDWYFRDNSTDLLNDMEMLQKAISNNNLNTINNILNKYEVDPDKTNDKMALSTSYCSTVYEFSDGVNHYLELFMNYTYITVEANHASSQSSGTYAAEYLGEIQAHTAAIMGSINAANNAPQADASRRWP